MLKCIFYYFVILIICLLKLLLVNKFLNVCGVFLKLFLMVICDWILFFWIYVVSCLLVFLKVLVNLFIKKFFIIICFLISVFWICGLIFVLGWLYDEIVLYIGICVKWFKCLNILLLIVLLIFLK